MDEIKAYWWEEEENKAHESIFSVVKFLKTNQSGIYENHVRNQRLYGNLNVLGMASQSYSQGMIGNQSLDRVGLNIVQSMCDTVTQKIAKNKPRPMFLTEGGNWSIQKKAEKLTKFIDGMFYQTKVYEKTPMVFRDCTVFGSGFIKPYRVGNKIYVDKVYPGEVLVDENEGKDGYPRSQYQVKFYPREYAMKLWPKFKNQIKNAAVADTFMPKHKSLSTHIAVVEAWHLPANEESKDGRHVLCVENCTLVDEEYKKNYFPNIKLDWSKRLQGYMGQGLSEQLTELQIAINKVLRDISITMHLFKPGIALEMGSKVIKTQVNNEIGRLMWFQGTMPTVWKPEAVPQEWFAHLENLYRKAYEIAGISQLSAQSTKPAGLNSGKALREYNNIESERFILIGMEWENFHLEIARHFIDLAKEIAEEGEGLDILVKDNDKLERIKWSEVKMDQDSFMMQLYPTSFFSKTPSGKLDDVTELAQAGFIEKDAALRLLDFPDIKSFTKFANAAYEDIQRQIELIIEHGEYHSPEPFQNLQLGIKMFQSAYLWAKANSVPEDRLELLRRWMEECNIMVQKTMQAAAPQQIPGGQAMPANPEAAPTSELMPMQGGM
jgi:hypothetical protein